MSTIVTPTTLGVYLNITIAADDARAQMLIDDAISQALSIITVGAVPDTGATEANLPAGAASVIRAAVARQWLNPSGVTQETAGSFSLTRPASTGSMFSKAEILALRRLAGRSGAFTIDVMPATAATDLPPWDIAASSIVPSWDVAP